MMTFSHNQIDVIENSENNSPAVDQQIEFDTSLTPQETEALVSSSENNECDHVTNAVENPEILQEAAIEEAGNADSFKAMSVPQEDVKPIFQQIQVDEADICLTVHVIRWNKRTAHMKRLKQSTTKWKWRTYRSLISSLL